MKISQASNGDKLKALAKLDGWKWTVVEYDSINSKVSVFNSEGGLEDYAIIRTTDVGEQNAFIISCLKNYLGSFNAAIPLMQKLELWVVIMKDLAFQITPVTATQLCDKILIFSNAYETTASLKS